MKKPRKMKNSYSKTTKSKKGRSFQANYDSYHRISKKENNTTLKEKFNPLKY